MSPKAPPPTIAPAITTGFAPSKTPAGYNTDIPATIVPNPVPAAVANNALAINVIATKTLPLAPTLYASHIIPSTKPDALRTDAKTPANIQHAIGVTAIGSAIPSITVSQ